MKFSARAFFLVITRSVARHDAAIHGGGTADAESTERHGVNGLLCRSTPHNYGIIRHHEEGFSPTR